MDLDVAGNVDGDWGARALGLGNFNASAQSVNGDNTLAEVDAEARGFDSVTVGENHPTQGDIEIKGSGNVTQIAQMVANVQAVTIGDDKTADNVTADVNLDAVGGDYAVGHGNITIKGDGNVSGDGVNRGSASALGVTSAANAAADITSAGFQLEGNSISINGAGDVQGRGLIGNWGQTTDGDYLNTEVFSVSAETTTGAATAGYGVAPTTFNAVGLGGAGGTITAGASGGDIKGWPVRRLTFQQAPPRAPRHPRAMPISLVSRN